LTSASTEVAMPGAMAPPMNSPLRAHAVERCRGAEVDDDQRRPVLRGSPRRRRRSGRPHLARSVDQQGHPRVRAGLDEEARSGRSHCSHIHSSVCCTGGTTFEMRDAVDGGERDAAASGERLDDEPVLVGRLLPPARSCATR
jgi:hypothetical protein